VYPTCEARWRDLISAQHSLTYFGSLSPSTLAGYTVVQPERQVGPVEKVLFLEPYNGLVLSSRLFTPRVNG
jgi:hypothetical protein